MRCAASFLVGDVVGSCLDEGTYCLHGHVTVGVLRLGAARLVQAVPWRMVIEFSVHVPAELLRSRLWVIKLLLWLSFERFKLGLKLLKLLFSITCDLDLRSWVHLCGLLGDRDH